MYCRKSLKEFLEGPIPIVEEKAIQMVAQGIILDLGCGTGMGLRRFALRNGWEEVGLDPQIIHLRTAKRHGMCLRGIGEALPFRDNTFNLAIASHVFHHVSNLRKVMQEISRTLKKDMFLIVAESTEDNPLHRTLRFFLKRFQGCPVTNKFYRQELEDLLRQNGFDLLIEQKSGVLVWIWLELARNVVGLKNFSEKMIQASGMVEDKLHKRVSKFCLECYILAQKK